VEEGRTSDWSSIDFGAFGVAVVPEVVKGVATSADRSTGREF